MWDFPSLASQIDWRLVFLTGLFCLLAAFGARKLILRIRTERDSAEQAQKQNALFDSALNNMSQGLLMFDAQDRLILFNRRYAELYRLDPSSIQLGSGFAEQFRLRKEAGTFPAPDLEKYLARVVDESGRFRGNPKDGRFETEGYETKLVELPLAVTVH